MKRLTLKAIAVAAALTMAGTAQAAPLVLKANPTDDDGTITLGDVFDGAGSAAGVVVGRRAGTTAVLDAAQVQVAARRAGMEWANERGLRRIVVRQGEATVSAAPSLSASARTGSTTRLLTYARDIPAGQIILDEDVVLGTVPTHQAPASTLDNADHVVGLSARRPLRAGQPVNTRDLAAPQVIARNDIVDVTYRIEGIELTLSGRAQRNAALGEPVSILNLQSGRLIDAVAVAPGRALAGPAAQAARHDRATANQFASR